MIDVIQSIIQELDGIDALHGHIYRRWPRTKVIVPSCIVSRISATPILTDADGTEIITRLVYAVDVNASSADEADALAEKVTDRLSRYNFHRTGDADLYDDITKTSRRAMSFMGTVDIRGKTFT